jgi:hypothetical protein
MVAAPDTTPGIPRRPRPDRSRRTRGMARPRTRRGDRSVRRRALCRRVLSEAAYCNVDVFGIEAKINELAEKRLIWGDLVESAHVVRQFGNDAAHGDLIEPPSHYETRDVLDIMDELLHQLFTTPARSERLRASR